MTELGKNATRGARVKRLRALRVIGGEGRALVNRVAALSGKKAEADAIAREFVLPGARPWRFSSAAPEMMKSRTAGLCRLGAN